MRDLHVDQPHRAVFERLDGRVGFVERQAQSYLRAFGERVSRLLLDPDARRPHGRDRADPRARPLPDRLTKSEPHGAQRVSSSGDDRRSRRENREATNDQALAFAAVVGTRLGTTAERGMTRTGQLASRTSLPDTLPSRAQRSGP